MRLSSEQEAFVEAIRDFAARETFDHDEPHSDEVAARMGELGWYGLQVPEEYGGSGGSFLDATLFLEETTAAASGVGYVLDLIVSGLNRFGPEQKRTFRACTAAGLASSIVRARGSGSDVPR